MEDQQLFDEFYDTNVAVDAAELQDEDDDDEGTPSWLTGQAGYLLAGLMLGVLVNLVGRMGASSAMQRAAAAASRGSYGRSRRRPRSSASSSIARWWRRRVAGSTSMRCVSS